MKRLAKIFRKFARSQNGTATVEFVILFPVFMTLFVSVFESGLMMTRLTMLERGLDLTVRAIRLSPGNANITHAAVKQMICDNAGILHDCTNSLKVELLQVSPNAWIAPSLAADCVDRTSEIEPVVTFNSGDEGDLLFIRACVVVDPMYPNIGLGLILSKDSSGGVMLVASSAFANEAR